MSDVGESDPGRSRSYHRLNDIYNHRCHHQHLLEVEDPSSRTRPQETATCNISFSSTLSKGCYLIVIMASNSELQLETDIQFRDVDYDKDIEKLLPIYIDAFEDQRQYINVSLATGEAHRAALEFIFSVRLFLLARLRDQQTIFLVATQDEAVIGAGAIAPNSSSNTFWDTVSSGMYLLPFKFGYGPFMRAMKLGGSTSGVEVDPLGGKVVMMAVDPKLHGRGVGSGLLKRLLSRWDADKTHGDLLLLTQLESSVKFYRGYGFELTAKVDKEGYSNWSMHRPQPVTPEDVAVVTPTGEVDAAQDKADDGAEDHVQLNP